MAAACVAVVLWAVGCGASKPHLDSTRLEQSIVTAIANQRHVAATVTCPQAPLRSGEVFDCTATPVKGGQPTYVQVSEADASGNVHFLGLR